MATRTSSSPDWATYPRRALRVRRRERFKQRLPKAGDLKPASINRLLGLPVDWGWLPLEAAHGIRKVKALREPPGRARSLSADEEHRLFHHLSDHLRPVVILAMLTRLRLGELASLRWANVQIDAARMKVTKIKNNRDRFVPLHEAAVELLRALPRRDEHVLTNARGRPLKVCGVSRAFHAAVTTAAISDFCFHDLRHEFATRLRRRDVPIDVITKLLGHQSLAMTQRYAHLEAPTLRRAVRALPAPAVARDT